MIRRIRKVKFEERREFSELIMSPEKTARVVPLAEDERPKSHEHALRIIAAQKSEIRGC